MTPERDDALGDPSLRWDTSIRTDEGNGINNSHRNMSPQREEDTLGVLPSDRLSGLSGLSIPSVRWDEEDQESLGCSFRSSRSRALVRHRSDGGEDSPNSSFRSLMRAQSIRCSSSMLHGAATLALTDNDIEAPKEEEYTNEVDGRPVTFALMNDVSPPPKVCRSARMRTRSVNLNVQHSSYRERVGHRIQRWLTKRDIPTLTTLHLLAFLIVNTMFAGFWSYEEGGCCGEEMTFAQTFDFAVQTSSTIGYGIYTPKGALNNALVVLLMSVSICLSTVYAGLLFFKFITPTANIQFSEVIAMSNVLGVPCLEIRVGNADGTSNKLINAEANLCITSVQLYKCPHEDEFRHTSQTEELKLAVSHKHKLDGVWILRHFVDESSPLYGLRFDEFPGNTIKAVELNVKAIHHITKGEVCSQASFQVDDIMVGFRFEQQYSWDPETNTEYFDYSKMSSTKPSMVWYPKEFDEAEYVYHA